MRRAAQVFEIVETGSESRLVEKVWTTRSTSETAFVSVAESHWQIVVTTHRDGTGVVIQGPNDAARSTPVPEDVEFFGVVLSLGTFMPTLPLASLVGGADARPSGAHGTFWLGGSWWEVPTLENADVFVDRLVREGLLVQDQLVVQALRADGNDVSLRTMQRRVRRATGLTQSIIRQIARAHEAVDALGQGAQVSDVAMDLGYADQPHLTRSLKRFVGQTPGLVLASGKHWSASSPLRSGA